MERYARPMEKPELPHKKPKKRSRHRLFVPILAGATSRERVIACVGSGVSICLTGLICGIIFGIGPYLPLMIAPVGASAVLLFAVPASPLAQPWPIIGGNTISACVGLVVVYWLHEPVLAIGLGVALAIATMSLARCLHPPGGAAALTMVLAGPTHQISDLLTHLLPIVVNSIVLVVLGYSFHKLSRRSYPHVANSIPALNDHLTRDIAPEQRVGVVTEDVDAALLILGQTFDIDREDLNLLLRTAEDQALVRLHGRLLCKDILSRDVIKIHRGENIITARHLLLQHNIRALPVVGETGKLLGIVGLRELASGGQTIDSLISPAITTSEADTAVSLLPVLSDGHTHAVVVVDKDQQIIGIITQSDMLAALGRLLMNEK